MTEQCSHSPATPIRFVSAFAGIGGFEAGFAQVGGFECVAQIEWEPDRQQVLARWFPGTPLFGDIKEVKGEQLLESVGSTELLVGGFPCTDLSVAAPHRKGLSGERSHHFFDFARLADELTPRWVLIENTPGLLTSHQGRDMGRLLRTLVDVGYSVAYRVVDAASIGGGQRRARVIVLGHRGDDPAPAAQVLDLPERCGEDPRLDHSGRSSATGPSPDGSVGEHNGRLIFRKSKRARSKTDFSTYVADTQINTLNGFDGGWGARQTNLVLDQGRLRVLTLEEWELAQGFTPGWTASMSDRARFLALGDAMNVHVARWLGERLRNVHHRIARAECMNPD